MKHGPRDKPQFNRKVVPMKEKKNVRNTRLFASTIDTDGKKLALATLGEKRFRSRIFGLSNVKKQRREKSPPQFSHLHHKASSNGRPVVFVLFGCQLWR